MAKLKKNRAFNYVDGTKIPTARKIIEFFFQDLYDRVEKNDEERTFDVFIVKPKEESELEVVKEEIQDFIDFWGSQYRFFFTANK